MDTHPIFKRHCQIVLTWTKPTYFSLVLVLRNSWFNPNEIFKNIKPEQLNKAVIISVQFDKLVRILKMHYKARSVSWS